MKVINEPDDIVEGNDNGLSNIFCKCGCRFSAKEKDIEEQIISIPYEKGIRKVLGMAKGYIHNRYITCPNCFRKLKVKFYVEDLKNE